MNNRYETISLPIPSDEDGYSGRECPECEKYFKIVSGTGLEGIDHCFCPYCGYKNTHDEFHTRAQIEYAKSVAINRFSRRIHRKLKRLESKFRPRRGDLLSIKFTVKSLPTRIRYPSELRLETRVDCTNCTLKFSIFGVYAFCPDCGLRNVKQILDTNLDIALKILELGVSSDTPVRNALIGNALTSVVAALDGFGREVCSAYASKSSSPSSAAKIRFQNLATARIQVKNNFAIDIGSSVSVSELELAKRCFQKRHILEHKSGVIDKEYLARAYDPAAKLGRKISVTESEVEELIDIVRKLGKHIFAEMEKLP